MQVSTRKLKIWDSRFGAPLAQSGIKVDWENNPHDFVLRTLEEMNLWEEILYCKYDMEAPISWQGPIGPIMAHSDPKVDLIWN